MITRDSYKTSRFCLIIVIDVRHAISIVDMLVDVKMNSKPTASSGLPRIKCNYFPLWTLLVVHQHNEIVFMVGYYNTY